MVKLLSVSVVADRLSLNSKTVYRLIKRGELVAVRIGRNLHVAEDRLDKFIADHETKAA